LTVQELLLLVQLAMLDNWYYYITSLLHMQASTYGTRMN